MIALAEGSVNPPGSITVSEGGLIYVVNNGGHKVTKHSSVKSDADVLTTMTVPFFQS